MSPLRETLAAGRGPTAKIRSRAAWRLAAIAWFIPAVQGCEAPDVGGGGRGAPDVQDVASVSDDAGRSFPAVPSRERVVSLIPALTETLLALDADSRLIARTRYDNDERVAGLPSVGGGLDPGIEDLVELGPDLVIAWPDRGARTVASTLERVGIPVYHAQVETFADVRRHTRHLGQLTGTGDAADRLVTGIDSVFDMLARRLRGAPRPTVFYVAERNPPRTTGPGTFMDSLFAAAGGRNAFSDLAGGWPIVAVEEIVRRDPDYIVVTEGEGPALSEVAGWSRLTSVRDGRVIRAQSDLFASPGPRIAQAAEWLARQLHPDRFP